MKLRALILGAAATGLITAMAAAGSGGAQAGYLPDEHYDGPAADAPARHRRRVRRAPFRGEGYRYVYAESWYGFKRVVAPVRHAEHGDQVRLPGGTWVYCEASCEYTLRKQSLDFWEGASGQGDSVSPGYFRWDFYIDSWGYPHRYNF